MATGRKTVVVGQVIDPTVWGNPLWDQSVQQFASAADRTAQFPAPLKGAVTWLDDVKRLQVWDGAAWQTLPAGDTGWIALPLVNGWAPYTPAGTYQPPQYRRVGGIVYVEGLISGGAPAAGGIVATLPAGFRPLLRMFRPVIVDPGSVRTTDVYANGDIRQGSAGFVTAWTQLSFAFVAEQ